jgi:hypothetical protein
MRIFKTLPLCVTVIGQSHAMISAEPPRSPIRSERPFSIILPAAGYTARLSSPSSVRAPSPLTTTVLSLPGGLEDNGGASFDFPDKRAMRAERDARIAAMLAFADALVARHRSAMDTGASSTRPALWTKLLEKLCFRRSKHESSVPQTNLSSF